MYWLNLFRDLRLADILDVVLVAVLIYTGVVWMRRTQAGFVAIGMLILAAFSLAARALDLRLMAWIFQGFFAIFVVIIVVIFQEELRQLFERLAMWGLGRRRAPSADDPTDTIVRAASDFARDRIGALIVLPGRQPIARHIRGGIELQGRISEPLLKSIFDPHSPGHDGAVIVEGDRVARFACHLPLSKDFRQLGNTGTRHSAALGLAELSDALCIVVSEERGAVSVAYDGKLRQLANPNEVAAEMRNFAEVIHPPARTRWSVVRSLRTNWIEKISAAAIAVSLWWIFVLGSRPHLMTFEVPITVINLPAEYVLEAVEPAQVNVTFSGLQREFYLFDQNRLQITVDASLVQLGRKTFDLSPQNVRYPGDVHLEDLQPTKIKISVKAPDHEM